VGACGEMGWEWTGGNEGAKTTVATGEGKEKTAGFRSLHLWNAWVGKDKADFGGLTV